MHRPIALLAVLLLAAPACEDTEPSGRDVLREAAEATRTGADYVAAQVAAYRQKAGDELARLQPKLDALKKRAAELSADTRAELSARLEQLESEKAALERRLAELSAESGEAWDDVKGGLSAALADLQAAIEQALARYDGDAAEDAPAGSAAPTEGTPPAGEAGEPPTSPSPPDGG